LSKDRGLRTVPVSPLTGLPEKLSNRAIDSPTQPKILSDVEERGDSWVYKRHFDPIIED